MTTSRYVSTLLGLLPSGFAWVAEPGTVLRSLLDCIVEEYDRIDARVSQLATEALPDTTDELLAEWEDFAGLPSDCAAQPANDNERRATLHARFVGLGFSDRALSFAFYEYVAQTLGYVITQGARMAPARAGVARAGDRVYGISWIYAWRVVTTSGANDALLECTIRELAPPFSTVIFEYV